MRMYLFITCFIAKVLIPAIKLASATTLSCDQESA